MKTRTDLIHRTLRNLGALPQGQTPSVEESDSIDDLIDPVFAQLQCAGRNPNHDSIDSNR